MDYCIISDIDDTLFKTSNGVLPYLSAFIHTFLIHPKPVNGMPHLFYTLEKLPASFWYVSASPQNILPIRGLNMSKFPKGKITIPSFKEALHIYLYGSLYRFKMSCLERITYSSSSNNLILFGDSLMKDPEIYGEFYRRYPDRILCILIRNYNNRGRLRSANRFKRAFIGVPLDVYCIFEEDVELYLYLKSKIVEIRYSRLLESISV
jgi:phosphatidate phosphatase APP1